MLKGTIYIANDINFCMANLNTCKTIAIVDEPDIINIPGKIGASVLIPPYEALAAIIDDDEYKFKYEYYRYLDTNITVCKFIDIILQALIVGTNMIFLVDKEGPDFISTLRDYFISNFGIYIGDPVNNFQYNQLYMPNIYNRLYANDSIDKEYYLKLFPQEIPFDPYILGKLMYEYGMGFSENNDAMVYFKKKSLIIKNGGTIQGVVRRLE